MAARNYCALITVEDHAFQGHLVKVNGATAYFRPYDGSDHDDVAQQACTALGRLIGKELGYTQAEPPERN